MEIDGERVRSLRIACVLGQQELAEAAGVSRETVAKVEAGDRVRSYPETIRKLAKALGVEPRELLKEEK